MPSLELGRAIAARLIAAFAPCQSGALHRLDELSQIIAGVSRRDIDNDQSVNQMPVLEREYHRGLAAHAVTENSGRSELMFLDESAQIFGQIVIALASAHGELP